MRAIRRAVPTIIVLATLTGCDHLTKVVARSELQHQPPRPLIAGVLDLRYVENTDVAFNLLRWMPEGARRPLLVVLGALALLGLAVALWRASGRRAHRWAGAFLLAGALGNYL